MMAVSLHAGPNQFFTSAGALLASGKVYTYAVGTSTPKAAYTDAGGTTPHANPIILNSRGEATIYWSGSYDVTLKDSADATIWGPVRVDQPDVSGTAATLDTAIRAELAAASAAGDGDAMIGWGAITAIVDGALTRYASLAAAVTGISTNRCTVVVRDDVTMAASATFPATAVVRIENNARITTTGFTLTFGAKPELHPGQNFVGTGTVVFSDGVAGGFRPQWWGAVGDGSTDSTTAIQACETAAETYAAVNGGATVQWDNPTVYYRTTSRILINKSGITWQGGGAGCVLVNDSITGGNCVEVGDNVANRTDVHIIGMNLQATQASTAAIRGQKATNLLVRDCTIVHYGAAGDGVRLTDSFCAKIRDNTFGSIRGYGIHATSSANAMLISGNRMDGLSTAATCGIYLDGTGNAIIGNTIETWNTCINGRGIKGGIVQGNYFESYIAAGVLFDASGAEGVDVRGNYFAATGSVVSIKISAGTGYVIGPNSYVGTHSGGAPIELTSGPANVYIEPGQVHDDAYIVKWPINHLALGHHLLSDNAYPAESGYVSPVTHTGTTTETTIKTYTGVKEHWGAGTHVDVIVAGQCTGTAGQKDIRLKLAGTTIATVTEAAAATDDWMIHARIDISSATVAVGSVLGYQGAAVELQDYLQAGVTIALSTTNPAITLTAQLGNAADSIILNQWKVQVIN